MSFEPWKPVLLRILSNASRSPKSYVGACAQFDVAKNPRYVGDVRGTYCNIFVWDCTRALGCEVPHWTSGKVGIGKEMRTPDMRAWLQDEKNGWKCRTKEDAIASANFGFPTIMSWEPTEPGIGHVAMLLPDGLIAQAGRHNLWKATPEEGFGKKLAQVLYFSHP